MIKEKKSALDGPGLDGANGVNNAPNITDETVIIYRSWFDCLMAQGPKRFALAMIALLLYAFYGKSVKSCNLPRPLESIVETFIPVIESNRKKRAGGKKGAEFGKTGGRPPKNSVEKSPKGLQHDTPLDTESDTPLDLHNNVTENEEENKYVAVSVDDTEPIGTPSEPHTNHDFFQPVFFFRNARYPEKQARKFVDHYTAVGWKLGGGEFLATDSQRLAMARSWEIRDDSCNRFHSEDLAMWKELYDKAPDDIKPLMLGDTINLRRTEDKAMVFGPARLNEWIEANLNITKPIVRQWMEDRKYLFIEKE